MRIQKKVALSGSILLLLVGASAVSSLLTSKGKKIASGYFFPDFVTETVSTIEVGDSATGVLLHQQEGIWRVTPRGTTVDFLADQVKVATLLDKIDIMKKDQLVSENKSNQTTLGVTKEKGITVTVKGDGGENTTFYIGNKSKNWRISKIREEGSKKVYDVSGSIRFAFKTELKDWRNRQIFSHPADSIAKILIFNQIELTRTADIVGEYWIAREGNNEAKANEKSMTSYLNSLTSFVSNDWANSNTPKATWLGAGGGASVDITLLDGTVETITVGLQDPNGRNRYFVKNSKREDLYYVVGSGAKIPFMNYKYFTFDPSAVVKATTVTDSGAVPATDSTAKTVQ